jgi:protein-tyrosine phosphatase
MIQNVLVICIGNICRSPVAEALLSLKLKNTEPTVTVSSAGLGAMIGHPADPLSIELAQHLGLDISQHRARQMTPEIVFSSELILAMTKDQQLQVEQQYPGVRGRVHRLGKWGEFDVPDPYRRPKAIFQQSIALIEQGVNEWHKKLWN